MNEETGLQRQEYGIQALEKMGEYIAKSGLFGMKTKDQAIALMLVAQAEGLHPATAAQDYHIIQGRPALKADAMLARFQRAGGTVKYLDYTDTKVAATFTHPQGGELTVDWDMARAKMAGLGTKDNWKNYPRAMLRARVISEGIRTISPGVLGGMYTPEEVSDFTPMDVNPAPPANAQKYLPPETHEDAPGSTNECNHDPEPPPPQDLAPPIDEGPETPEDKTLSHRQEIRQLLMEMNGDDKAAASTQLKALTSFTAKDGKEVPGKTHVKFLTDKQVPFLLKRVRDLHDNWSAGN